MENQEFSIEEKMELKKRGFFVKEIINFMDFTKLYWLYIGGIIGLSFPIIILTILIGSPILSYLGLLSDVNLLIMSGIFGGLPTFFLLRAIFFYTLIGKFFYTNDKVIAFGKKLPQDQPIKYLKWIRWSLWLKEKKVKKTLIIKDVILHIILNPQEIIVGFFVIMTSIIVIFSILYIFYTNNILFSAFLYTLLYGFIGVFGIPSLAYTLRQLVEHFHPLYAFGNLGEKIQNLTPQIESQSQLIQNEFKKDIDFVTLHSGFEELSHTFNTIIALVLKLEKIEEQANKGNLFDSEKYINSLRTDITKPLTSLKEFLMKQRQELIESQRELSRVRIGGSEGSGNRDLTSKRSESLIVELDTNIGAIETMIQKMG